MKVTIEPPREGPALGRISTISARGVNIIGRPPDDVASPSPMIDIVTLLACFGGNWHCKLVEDKSMACVAFCMPNRQNKSEPTKLLPYTVTDTAVNSGAMLGSTFRTCIAGTTSRTTACVEVSTRPPTTTSIRTVPTSSAGRMHFNKVFETNVVGIASSDPLCLHWLASENPSPNTVTKLGKAACTLTGRTASRRTGERYKKDKPEISGLLSTVISTGVELAPSEADGATKMAVPSPTLVHSTPFEPK